jgi:hypothetical protein
MTQIQKAGLIITAGLTTPKRYGKKPRPVWNVSGNLAPWTSLLYDMGGKKYHGVFSFFEDPTDRLERQLAITEPETYEDRLKARAERAEARVARRSDWADKAHRRSDAAFRGAMGAIDGIPPGQPILVGHHSERRHRAALNRHDSRMRRAIDESQLAQRHEQRAAGAERTADRARGKVGPAFAERRLREAEAEIRRIDRLLARRPDCVTCFRPVNEDNTCTDGCSGPLERASPAAVERMAAWRKRIEGSREQQVQKCDYWQRVFADVGGAAYSRSNINAGDRVKVRYHDWARVIRANSKTISVAWDEGPLRGMSGRYLYTEVKAHESKAKGQEV